MKKQLANTELFIIIIATAVTPLLAHAQPTTAGTIGDVFIDLANQAFVIIQVLIPVAFGAAVVFFFWGLAMFILRADDSSARERGKAIMIWGTFAIFIMASIWGINKILQDTFSISSTSQITIPRIYK